MSIASFSSDTIENSDTSPCYDDPLESANVISNLMKPFYQTENSEEPSELLTRLFKDRNISHGALNSIIPQKALHETKLMLLNNFWNNSTCSNTLKRDYKLDEGVTPLTYENLQIWSPEFVTEVVDSILKIDYVKKKNLHFNATLTKPYGLGTDHSDMMEFLARIIVTFMLSPDGKMTKHFCISHPGYNNRMQESMAIGCHVFVVLDSKSSGYAEEWKEMWHQAKAPGCEMLTFVVSVHGDDLPQGITLAQFLADWSESSGGVFETYDKLYYTENE